MEFHISRTTRDRYQFDKLIFSLNGNVIFANFHAARLFAQKMNLKRDVIHFPEKSVKAGQINALGLIDEILHYVFRSYRQQNNPLVLENLDVYLESKFGRQSVDLWCWKFVVNFLLFLSTKKRVISKSTCR